jgi:hypothetical protein
MNALEFVVVVGLAVLALNLIVAAFSGFNGPQC